MKIIVGPVPEELATPAPVPEVAAPVAAPEVVDAAPVTYLLRNVDGDTWAAFTAQAKRDGVTARAALLHLIAAYTDGRVTLGARRARRSS